MTEGVTTWCLRVDLVAVVALLLPCGPGSNNNRSWRHFVNNTIKRQRSPYGAVMTASVALFLHKHCPCCEFCQMPTHCWRGEMQETKNICFWYETTSYKLLYQTLMHAFSPGIQLKTDTACFNWLLTCLLSMSYGKSSSTCKEAAVFHCTVLSSFAFWFSPNDTRNNEDAN